MTCLSCSQLYKIPRIPQLGARESGPMLSKLFFILALPLPFSHTYSALTPIFCRSTNELWCSCFAI